MNTERIDVIGFPVRIRVSDFDVGEQLHWREFHGVITGTFELDTQPRWIVSLPVPITYEGNDLHHLIVAARHENRPLDCVRRITIPISALGSNTGEITRAKTLVQRWRGGGLVFSGSMDYGEQ